MVNNVDTIRELISFNDEFDFYFLQILKRRKDNPDLKRDMVVISNYHIESTEQYDSLMPHIINMCNAENARAYIRLNRRNYKHLSYHMLKHVVALISSNMFKALKGSFDSVCGRNHKDPDKTWVVDVDYDLIYSPTDPRKTGEYLLCDIEREVERLQKETKKEPYMVTLPTKNGLHLITRPFNVKAFKMKFPDMTVHKDNPTILYCP